MKFPKKSAEVAWRKFQNRTVILQLGQQRLFHELDEMGSYIWNLADGTRSIDEIAKSISENYEVDKSQAQSEAQLFLAELDRKGLLNWTEISN